MGAVLRAALSGKEPRRNRAGTLSAFEQRARRRGRSVFNETSLVIGGKPAISAFQRPVPIRQALSSACASPPLAILPTAASSSR